MQTQQVSAGFNTTIVLRMEGLSISMYKGRWLWGLATTFDGFVSSFLVAQLHFQHARGRPWPQESRYKLSLGGENWDTLAGFCVLSAGLSKRLDGHMPVFFLAGANAPRWKETRRRGQRLQAVIRSDPSRCGHGSTATDQPSECAVSPGERAQPCDLRHKPSLSILGRPKPSTSFILQYSKISQDSSDIFRTFFNTLTSRSLGQGGILQRATPRGRSASWYPGVERTTGTFGLLLAKPQLPCFRVLNTSNWGDLALTSPYLLALHETFWSLPLPNLKEVSRQSSCWSFQEVDR